MPKLPASVRIKLVCVFLLFYLLIPKISSAVIVNRTSFELPVPVSRFLLPTVSSWLNFDGRNYLDIVLSGYHIKNNMDLAVFFPLYPLLIRILSVDLLLNPVLVGFLISLTSLITGSFLFYRFIARQNPVLADRSLFLLLVFPTAFFFLAYYTESLFLLLSVSFFYLLGKDRFWSASIVCALATATRITGLALIPALAWRLFQRYHRTGIFPTPLIISPLGFLSYLVYSQVELGGWMAAFSGQSFWRRQFSLLNPVTSLWEWAAKVFSGPGSGYDSPFVYPVIVIEFSAVIFLLTVIIISFRKIPSDQYLYLISSTLLFLFAGNFSSVHRYLAVLFPIHIFMAARLHRFGFRLYSVVSFSLLIFLSFLFTRGYWSG